jgi:hypothetical protein
MATLADMKARIVAETMRPDLGGNGEYGVNAVANEITSAINFYRSKRFYFSEKRTVVTFDTVNDQSDYDETAQANIPHLISIDSVTVTDTGTVNPVCPISPERMELLIGGVSPLGNPPRHYSYYAQVLRLYPIPNDVYPMRVTGVIRIPAPATDEETNNVWMNDAEELIRARAKKAIYADWMGDPQMAAVMNSKELEAFQSLQAETSRRTPGSTVQSYDLR